MTPPRVHPVRAGRIRDEARTAAAGLAVLPGDRVAIASPDPRHQLGLALAVLRRGATAAILDPTWPPTVRDAALAACGASVELTGEPGRPVAERRDRPPGEDRGPGWIAFTSGSTGTPRAVRRTLGSWTASYRTFDALTGIGPRDRVLVPGALSSSLCAFSALHAVASGARVVLLPRWTPAAVADADVVHLVPTMLADLVRAAPAGFAPRLLVCAGSTLDPGLAAAVAHRWPGARLLEYYGSTEQSFVTVRTDGPATTVGTAFPGVVLQVGGPGAAPGATGEIRCRSPYVAESVLDGSREIPLAVDGWVGVGDRGHLDADGRLTLTGRTRIVSGGVVVEPAAVEAALRAAGADDVVVVGLPHPRLGEVVCAVVDGGPGRDVLRTRVRAGLRSAERPRVWLAVSPLPRTPAGKPDRAGLLAAARAGELPALP